MYWAQHMYLYHIDPNIAAVQDTQKVLHFKIWPVLGIHFGGIYPLLSKTYALPCISHTYFIFIGSLPKG